MGDVLFSLHYTSTSPSTAFLRHWMVMDRPSSDCEDDPEFVGEAVGDSEAPVDDTINVLPSFGTVDNEDDAESCCYGETQGREDGLKSAEREGCGRDHIVVEMYQPRSPDPEADRRFWETCLADDKVTAFESEKRAWENSPEAQARREALNPWREIDSNTREPS